MTKINPPLPKTTVQDCDCAAMARAALFPKQINRDGTHTTIFPAVSALSIIRDNLIAANPQQAESSLFPKRVVVVKEIGHNEDPTSTLKWNGQPDIDVKTASFDVIPNVLVVKCMSCAGMTGISKSCKSFIEPSQEDECSSKIVLCTDRLLQRGGDYKPSPSTSHTASLLSSDMPPRSYASVEETLAHDVTIVGTRLNYTNRTIIQNDDSGTESSCQDAAVAEILAARAAECFYERKYSEVKRGSGLPRGYSLLPTFLQRTFMNRCVESVATRNVTQDYTYGKEEGSKCVKEAMSSSSLE